MPDLATSDRTEEKRYRSSGIRGVHLAINIGISLALWGSDLAGRHQPPGDLAVMDVSSEVGARALGARLEAYWLSRGITIRTWVEPVGDSRKCEGGVCWAVRSNLSAAACVESSPPQRGRDFADG
jgi:hypothetical protein